MEADGREEVQVEEVEEMEEVEEESRGSLQQLPSVSLRTEQPLVLFITRNSIMNGCKLGRGALICWRGGGVSE